MKTGIFHWTLSILASTFCLAAIGLLSACGNSGGSSSSSDPLAQIDNATKTNVANALGYETFNPAQIPAAIIADLIAPANSNESFGARTTAYFNGLNNNPLTFNPDFTPLYDNLLEYTGSLNPQQVLGIDGFRAPDGANGYLQLPQIPTPTTLTFPQADAFDLSAQFGWYWVGGNAIGADGHQYGILLMLLSTPLLPPQQAFAAGLTATGNEVTQLQFEVNQAGGPHYQARPTVVAGTTGLLNFPQGYLSASMGVNSIQSQNGASGSFFPMQMQATGWDYSTGTAVPIQINITFTSGSNRMLEGTYGCLPCCGGVGTLYYSVPLLTVGAGSTVTINGNTVSLLSGSFWLDHQWGTSGNFNTDVMRAWNNTQTPGPPGWDFFSMDFSGQRELMAWAPHSSANSQFYNVTGPTPPGTMTVPVTGKYLDATGNVTNVSGTLNVTGWIQSTTSTDPALFQPTGVWYPNSWQFSFPTLPSDMQNFTLAPIVNQASNLFFASGTEYQEAPVNIIDSNGTQIGTAFAEATDYAVSVPAELSNELAIANLPDTPSAFVVPGPSESLVNQSKSFIAEPQNQAQLAVQLIQCALSSLSRYGNGE